MLVRCEHCGTALPQEATMCYKCGNKRTPFTPPPIPEADSNELEALRIKNAKTKRICRKIIPWILVIGAIVLIVGCFTIDNDGGAILTIGVCIGMPAFCTWVVLESCAESKLDKKEREIQSTQEPPKPSPEEYEQRVRDFAEEEKAGGMITKERHATAATVEKITPTIKCPTCGSTNVERVSTMTKAVNVVAFGVFGNKHNKQFKCKSCRYMWRKEQFVWRN